MDITRTIAEYVASPPSLPESALRAVGRVLVDTVGVGIAGAGDEGGAAFEILSTVVGGGAGGPSTVVDGRMASPPTAALLNGTACHVLDYDDVSHAMTGHPSTVLVPALLAAGEAEGADGRSLALGFSTGLQVAGALRAGLGASHYARGWHATSSIGTVAAAAGVAAMLGLTADEATRALGVAASFAGGSRANFGTMTKPLHAGHAAQWGVISASLARRGFTGNERQLDAETGYFALFGDADLDAAERVLHGEQILLSGRGINVKKYPCCYFAHRAIDATLELREAGAFDDVESVDVVVPPGSTKALTFGRPQTPLEAKFNAPYVIANALVRGSSGLESFTVEAIGSPMVAQLMPSIRWSEAQQPPVGPSTWTEGYAVVTARSTDGSERTVRVDIPRGDCRNALDDEELRAKFTACTTPEIGSQAAGSLFDDLYELPSAPSVSTWASALPGATERGRRPQNGD